jgi:hypothetical protein
MMGHAEYTHSIFNDHNPLMSQVPEVRLLMVGYEFGGVDIFSVGSASKLPQQLPLYSMGTVYTSQQRGRPVHFGYQQAANVSHYNHCSHCALCTLYRYRYRYRYRYLFLFLFCLF